MFKPALKSRVYLGAILASFMAVPSSDAVSSMPALQILVGDTTWELAPRLNSDKETWSFGEQGQSIVTDEFSIHLTGTLDPDPSIAYGIAVTDLGAPSSFAFLFSIPIVPTGPTTSVNSSIVGGLTDLTGNGVSITPFLDPATLQQSFVTTPSTSMGVDVGPAFSAGPGAAGALYSYGPHAAGPTTGPSGVWTGLEILLSFTLSGDGDIAAITGFAEVVTSSRGGGNPVPDAGPGLIGLGALLLVTFLGHTVRHDSKSF